MTFSAAIWAIVGGTLAVSLGLYTLQYFIFRKGRLRYVGLVNGLGFGAGPAMVFAINGQYWVALMWLVVVTPAPVLSWYAYWRLLKPQYQERGLSW